MTLLHGIVCFYDVGFGVRAVSRKTPIYFMIIIRNIKKIKNHRKRAKSEKISGATYIWRVKSEVWIKSYGRLKILTSRGANFGYRGPILGLKKRKIIRI